MKKFAFVILHYYTMDETIKCIDSIRNIIKYNNYEIVIVDNGSKNNTGIELQEKYQNEEDIHIILSKDNLGFAKGNNLGFKYAKDNLNPDFIIMINNDIVMLQDEFCNKIIDEYNNSKFAVLGPKIYLPNNVVCNYPDNLFTIKEYKRKYKENKCFYFLNKYHMRYLYAIYDRLSKLVRKKSVINTDIRKEDVLLNGCCLIFSKEYIDKFDGIDDRTFLYFEEHLLLIRLRKNNLKSVYNPDLEILHNESVSTKKTNKNKSSKFNFVLDNELKSLKIVIDEMEK